MEYQGFILDEKNLFLDSTPKALPTTRINKNEGAIILDQTNYLMWKSHVTNLLVKVGTFYIIDGSYDASTTTAVVENEEGENKSLTDPKLLPLLDKEITNLMRRRMSEEIKASFPTDSYASSRSLWIAIEEKFATQTKAFLRQLRLQFRSMRQDTPSITKYLQRVEEIVNAHEASGKQIPKEDLVIEVLAGLGPEYEFELAGTQQSKMHSYEEVTKILLDQKTELDSKSLLHYQPIFSPKIGN